MQLITLVETRSGPVLVRLDREQVRSEDDTAGLECSLPSEKDLANLGPALSPRTYRELALKYLLNLYPEQGPAQAQLSHPIASMVVTTILREVERFARKQAGKQLVEAEL